jgi:CheY-like chemotaxis protein
MTAAAPVEAIQASLAFGPNVAVPDVGLPGMNGYELAAELRKGFGRALRVLTLSGYGQAADRALSGAAGAERHFVKPVDPEELIAALLTSK